MKLRVFQYEDPNARNYVYQGKPCVKTNSTNVAVGTNHAGGEAYTMSKEMELYSAVADCMLSPMTYETVDSRLERIIKLISDCDGRYVAQLAVYTRTQMNMRSLPLLLVAQLARTHNGDNLVSKTVSSVVRRADDIMELLSCYYWLQDQGDNTQIRKGFRGLSRQLQLGLKEAFNRFDQYQFAKYNNPNRTITLKQALRIVHPKAKNPQQQEIFARIASGTLKSAYTWETELSALGQRHFASEEEKSKTFAQKWSELILSGRVGYMALLRNLRNILSLKDVSDQAMEKLVATLSERDIVLRSKQLPFRFLRAYREVKSMDSRWTPAIVQALDDATAHVAQNIEGIDIEGKDKDARVVIATDTSESMRQCISSRSKIELLDIGLMMSMLLRSRYQQVVAGVFATEWKEIATSSNNILANVEIMRGSMYSAGRDTYGHKVLWDLTNRKVVADKVILFTDCQLWDLKNWRGSHIESMRKAWADYKTRVAPKAKLYIFDLAGYGQSPISLAKKDVYLIAGWSDKVLDIIAACDRGHSPLHEVRKKNI